MVHVLGATCEDSRAPAEGVETSDYCSLVDVALYQILAVMITTT
jgi:hypothetical protein